MSTRHSDLRAGFIERVGVALLLALCVAILLSSTRFFIGYLNALVLATSMAASAYAIWLVSRSDERRGLLLVTVGWAASLLGLCALMLSPLLHSIGLLIMLWAMRALYVYRAPVDAILDTGLVLFSALAAYWTFMQTSSAALATWSAFLVMALLVRLPRRLATESADSAALDRFDRAFCRAKAAADQAVANLNQA